MRIGPHRQATRNTDTGSGFAQAGMCFFMERVALGRGKVLGPNALHMDECALPRAVEVVLERGERDCAGAENLKLKI